MQSPTATGIDPESIERLRASHEEELRLKHQSQQDMVRRKSVQANLGSSGLMDGLAWAANVAEWGELQALAELRYGKAASWIGWLADQSAGECCSAKVYFAVKTGFENLTGRKQNADFAEKNPLSERLAKPRNWWTAATGEQGMRDHKHEQASYVDGFVSGALQFLERISPSILAP